MKKMQNQEKTSTYEDWSERDSLPTSDPIGDVEEKTYIGVDWSADYLKDNSECSIRCKRASVTCQ